MDQNNTIIVVDTVLLFDDITDRVGGSVCYWYTCCKCKTGPVRY